MDFNFFDFIETGLCKCRFDGTIISINKTAYNILDLDDKFQDISDVTGKNIFDLYPDYKRIFDRVYTDGGIKYLNTPLETVKGNRKVLSNYYYIDKQGDSDQEVYIILKEITESKNIENQLRISEKKLMSIIDLIPDIVYRLDNNGIITFISEGVQKYGYIPEELIGTSIMDIVHPEDRDKTKFRINERRTGERNTKFFEIRLLTNLKDSVPFQIEDREIIDSQYFTINAEGLYLDSKNENMEFAGTQGIARDISKRKYSELALKLSEGKYFTILNNLQDGYYEIDLNGRIIFANRSLCNMLAMEKDDLVGNNYRKIIPEDQFNPADMKFNNFDADLSTKSIIWTGSKKDGKKIQMEGSISVMMDKNNKPVSFIGSARNITARHKMEQELFRAKKLEAIGIFSGGIAHDYNNALTAIIGNISLAKMEIDQDDEKLHEILDDAHEASLRVRDLTQQLSTFSKGGKPDKNEISIANLTNDTADSVFADFNGIYEIFTDDDLWLVEVDEFQLAHVLEYIFVNSIEAIQGSGIISINVENVVIETEESHHEITLRKGNYLKISTKDNGTGIAEENIDKIFDPYFSTKDFQSGMGLAISYAIIKRHHGYIDVKSKEGEGSTFFIYLPV